MLLEKIREPLLSKSSPKQFERAEKEERFTGREKKGAEDIARPMCAQINPRIADGESEEPIEPTPAPIKQRAANGDDGVVGHVAGWK